jgi:hypothetical protein
MQYYLMNVKNQHNKDNFLRNKSQTFKASYEQEVSAKLAKAIKGKMVNS